jgi:hypothetical protein
LPSSCRVVVPPVAIVVLPIALLTLTVVVLLIAIAVLPVAVLPLAIMPPITVVVPRRCVTHSSPRPAKSCTYSKK